MRKATMACAFMASVLLTSGAVAQERDRDKTPRTPPAGWTEIGNSHAKHMSDNDTIKVFAPNNKFRQLKVAVADASLHVKEMIVVYDDGGKENVPIRYVVQKGSESDALDLQRPGRPIRQVDFKYDTRGWLHGSADVFLYGR
ncbi:hypothetical protein SAMN06295912_108165 [Sphingomonas laterariae]|uniref:Uncharacterized protein n=1 Tax=Edaphosphingomonas laterariae TaxID=861865 RepID=A0A239FBL6_9SPHN|nr:hypothetical protein [Sphingomonas laterariae]SNS54289.1 hypothetical protein SAMN06295912_108165 [Sphingomonas laterariae]